MNTAALLFYIGRILIVEALAMIPSMTISLLNGEDMSWRAFIVTIATLAVIGLAISLPVSKKNRELHSREGIVIVAISWILLSVFGAMPFFLSREIPSYIDAFFECVSGLTTTGATILTDVEALSRGLVFWRSFTHWIGGMGVLVFTLAIMPEAYKSSRTTHTGGGDLLHLVQAETPGPIVGKLVPKTAHTAAILYIIYVGLTLLQIIFLLCGGMPAFDAVMISLGTAGTGGFAVRNAGIAAYSTYCQVVIAIFMVLFGVNFNIYFLILTGNIRRALKSEEMHVYFGILFATTAVIAVNVISYFKNIWEAIHHSFFTVSSIITTTGFATVDFNTWPQFTHYILLFLMVIGGSSGSTAGGIKVIRSMIVTKGAMHSFRSMLHNRRVKVITIDGKAIDESVVSKVNVYLNIYVVLSAISLLILSLDAISFEESFSSVIACINNVGPGFGRMGAVGNYSTLSNVSKLTLSVDMLLGRLEIYPIIMLFMPSMWRRTG